MSLFRKQKNSGATKVVEEMEVTQNRNLHIKIKFSGEVLREDKISIGLTQVT